jgi:hypothetical protein
MSRLYSRKERDRIREITALCHSHQSAAESWSRLLMDHLIKNNLLRDSQHGFMPNRSCTTNLLEFFEVVTGGSSGQRRPLRHHFPGLRESVRQGTEREATGETYAHGISGEPLAWTESWLSGRRKRVVINGEESSWEGFCQGSHKEASSAHHFSRSSSTT